MTDARIIENGQSLTIEIDTDIYPNVETSNLRELFFAKAFANNDDFVEFDFKD